MQRHVCDTVYRNATKFVMRCNAQVVYNELMLYVLGHQEQTGAVASVLGS